MYPLWNDLVTHSWRPNPHTIHHAPSVEQVTTMMLKLSVEETKTSISDMTVTMAQTVMLSLERVSKYVWLETGTDNSREALSNEDAAD